MTAVALLAPDHRPGATECSSPKRPSLYWERYNPSPDLQTGTGDARFQVLLEQPGSEYNIMASESKDQGDHKQVFLSFRVPAAPL